MSYNTELQSNNTDLQTILNTINNLPEAGSGGIKSSDVTVTQNMIPNTMSALTADSNDKVVTGTAAMNGDVSASMDGINTKSVNIPSGYTTGGTVSLTDDIDNEVDAQADLIAEISAALEGKTAGGTTIETCNVTITFGYTSMSMGSTKRYMPKITLIGYIDNEGNGSVEVFANKTGSDPGNVTRTFVMQKNQMLVLSSSLGSDITAISSVVIDGYLNYLGNNAEGTSGCYMVYSDLTITC